MGLTIKLCLFAHFPNYVLYSNRLLFDTWSCLGLKMWPYSTPDHPRSHSSRRWCLKRIRLEWESPTTLLPSCMSSISWDLRQHDHLSLVFYRTDQKPALVIDGLFGFSFKPPIRPDMKPFLQILASAPTILSIDIPSGWDVENGPPSEPESDPSLVLTPHTLVSLSAPKKCASFLPVGTLHFLGGRFLPPQLDKKYSLNLPPYPGTDCILQLWKLGRMLVDTLKIIFSRHENCWDLI